jgi:uncharacterized protein YegL
MAEHTNQLHNVRLVDDNPEPRAPCLILCDTSASMAGERIEALNRGLRVLAESLVEDPLAATRVEICLLSFNDEVSVVCDWVSAQEFEAPVLTAEGTTRIGSGILQALKQIQARKDDLRQSDRQWFRPWLILMTDGLPTDPPDALENAATALKTAIARNSVLCFPVGVGDADLDLLERITGVKAQRLSGLRFDELFQWVSASIGKVVNADEQTGQVTFDPIDVWATSEVR